MSTQIPSWRKPEQMPEGDSLVLDILMFLEGTSKYSTERELALEKVFTITTWCLNVTAIQLEDIMSILWAYGSESIKPMLRACSEDASVEAINTAYILIRQYNLPRGLTSQGTLDEIKVRYTGLVEKTKEKLIGAGRSVVAWHNHKLYEFHPCGLSTEVELKNRYTTTVHSGGIVETVIHLTEEEKNQLTVSGPLFESAKPKPVRWYATNWFSWIVFILFLIMWFTALCGDVILILANRLLGIQ
jgi:hypothetical protein